MITNAQRQALYGQAANHWTSKFIDEPARVRIVDATIREYQSELKERPGQEPRDWIIRNRVKADPEVKKFIPVWILIAIGGWLIQFLLDYLFKQEAYTRGAG